MSPVPGGGPPSPPCPPFNDSPAPPGHEDHFQVQTQRERTGRGREKRMKTKCKKPEELSTLST